MEGVYKMRLNYFELLGVNPETPNVYLPEALAAREVELPSEEFSPAAKSARSEILKVRLPLTGRHAWCGAYYSCC